MDVLLTGATGFIGSRLLNIIKNNKDIHLTLLSREEIEGYECILHSDYKIEPNSINTKFDVVILLGGITPKGKGNDNEANYVSNITSTINIYNGLKNKPKRIIYVSTTSVYKKSNIITESTELTTDNMYALSKIVAERFIQESCNNDGLGWCILRLGPIYGPGEERYNKIVGSFIRKAINNENIAITSNGLESRNLTYVDDVANIVLRATEDDKFVNEIFNVVSPYRLSVKDLALLITDIAYSSSKIEIKNINEGRDDNYLAEKIVNVVGVNSFTDVNEGIKRTYEYFKENNFE